MTLEERDFPNGGNLKRHFRREFTVSLLQNPREAEQYDTRKLPELGQVQARGRGYTGAGQPALTLPCEGCGSSLEGSCLSLRCAGPSGRFPFYGVWFLLNGNSSLVGLESLQVGLEGGLTCERLKLLL